MTHLTADKPPMSLSVRGASKSYGDSDALTPTDLDFPAGRTTVLIGPSGCGKSTLLRLLVGLIRPSSGDVVIDGEPLTPANVRGVRHRVGYVIQDGGLFPHLTALGNITLLARHLNRPAGEIDRRVAELAGLTSFPEDALSRHPGEMSGGQRQRVALMRALMLDPDALLLDEPLGALDPMIRADLQADLREIFRRLGKTVVLVTHDLNEAAYFADEVVLMRDGRVVQRGPMAELTDTPAEEFVTKFVQAQRGTP